MEGLSSAIEGDGQLHGRPLGTHVGMIPSVQALFVQPGHELVGYLDVVLVREGNVRVAEKAHLGQGDQGGVTAMAVDCLYKLSRSEPCAAPDFGVVVVGNLLGNVVAKDNEYGHAGELFELIQRDGWRILCSHVQLFPGDVRRDLALGEDKVRGLIGYYGLHKVGLGESSSPAVLAASRMRHEDARACHDKEFAYSFPEACPVRFLPCVLGLLPEELVDGGPVHGHLDIGKGPGLCRRYPKAEAEGVPGCALVESRGGGSLAPFEMRELVARIRALLRRTRDAQGTSPAEGSAGEGAQTRPSILRFGPWRLNVGARNLIDEKDVTVSLSAMEFRLLMMFLQRPQQIVSRESILEHMADRTDSYDRSIDVQVSRLLAKLRDSGRNPTLIRTMRGDGYMLAVPVTREEGQGDR